MRPTIPLPTRIVFIFSHHLRVPSFKGSHSHHPLVQMPFCPQQHWDCLACSSEFHDAPSGPIPESFCLPELFRHFGRTIQQPPRSRLQHQTYATHLLVITNMALGVATWEFEFPACCPTSILTLLGWGSKDRATGRW